MTHKCHFYRLKKLSKMVSNLLACITINFIVVSWSFNYIFIGGVLKYIIVPSLVIIMIIKEAANNN